MQHVVTAIKEGWSVGRLSREAGVSRTVAGDVLASFSTKLVDKAESELGLLATTMQQAAAKERPAVVQRLQRVGKVADTLIAKVEQLVALIDPEEVANELEIEDEEQGYGGSLRRQRAPVPIESRLGALATALKAASAASKDAWTCFKDASGLSFAEDQARAKLKDDAKTPHAMVPGILVELDDQGQR
jgi:hypothetical protein